MELTRMRLRGVLRYFSASKTPVSARLLASVAPDVSQARSRDSSGGRLWSFWLHGELVWAPAQVHGDCLSWPKTSIGCT